MCESNTFEQTVIMYKYVFDVEMDWRKEMFLFNDAVNTFYLRLYGVIHMVKDHSDSERKPAPAT